MLQRSYSNTLIRWADRKNSIAGLYERMLNTRFRGLLTTTQGWRDFDEAMHRMNPEGEAVAGVAEQNAEKLFKFIGKNRHDYLMFKKTLEGRSAIADQPVELDPYSACQNCGIV